MRGEGLQGALILEMVGYTDSTPGSQVVPPFLGIEVPRTGDFLAAVGDTRSRALLQGFLAGAKATVPDLPVVAYRTRLRGWLLPLTRLSDNASFWDARYPALMLTDTAFLRNPHYHLWSDRSETLDFEFMARVVEATAGAVLRLAATSCLFWLLAYAVIVYIAVVHLPLANRASTLRAAESNLTQVRHDTGIASDQDVAQAETQLNTTEAQATDLTLQRARLEHAVALLVGKPASTFSLSLQRCLARRSGSSVPSGRRRVS